MPDAYDILGPAWSAAAIARRKWVEQAWSGNRKGHQIPPEGDWTICFFRAGRGWGKSQAQSGWLWWEAWTVPNSIGHYLGATLSDVRGTLFEGPAGLLSVIPNECLMGASREKAYNKTTHELRLANNSLIRGFATTEQAERLRGPQCHFLCADEAAAWDRPAGNLETAFNNAMYGVRLVRPDGIPARVVVGTTPRPIPFLKRLEKRADVITIRGSSYENLANLSTTYRNQLLSQAGTLMGKQEIDGDYIDEESDLTIWKRRWFRLWPAEKPLPDFSFVIESYDTAFEEDQYDNKKSKVDPTACIVLGVFNIAQCFSDKERVALGVGRLRYGVLMCEAWSERLGFPELLDRARTQHKTKWGKGKRKADVVLIENKGSGISLRQSLAGHGVPTWPYNPHRESKTMRAHAAAPLLKDGVFFVPESGKLDRKGLPRDWAELFLEQVCAFAGPGSVEHDDFCLVAGIMIRMADGSDKPIELVIVGDEVATPCGPARVTASGMTGIRPTWILNEGLLEGTADHPVFCDGKWTPLAKLPVHGVLETLNSFSERNPWDLPRQALLRLKLLFSTVGATIGIRIPHSARNAFTTCEPAGFCIATYGNITTAPFRRTTTFTTRMVMTEIIRETLSAFRKGIIDPEFTETTAGSALKAQNNWRTLLQFGTRRKHGTLLRKALLGIGNTLRNTILGESQEKRTKLSEKDRAENVAPSSNTRTTEKRLAAPFAKIDSENGNLVFALTSSGDAKPVYNLTVADAHCYYANGVLVHNCDAASQAILYLRDRDLLVGAPQKAYVDFEDEREAERQCAISLRDGEKSQRRENPYGV